MVELEFSLLSNEPNTQQQLQLALQKFEAEYGIKVHIQPMDWANARTELVDFALFKTGADVSEIGSTWLGSFAAMNALQPFARNETQALGGSAAFLDKAWESCFAGCHIYALPWHVDTRNVYYRRDLMQAAGIDEKDAFSQKNIVLTLTKLQESGVAIAWAAPVQGSSTPLHFAVSWIWAAGGELMQPDGRSVCFTEPKAITGLRSYFQTFLPFLQLPQARNLTEESSNTLFREGKAAATVSGPWLLRHIRRGDAEPIVAENLGMAPTPGIPFIGGSNLVVWQHSLQAKASIQLAQFLCNFEVQANHLRPIGHIPTRLDALNESAFMDDPHYHQVYRSLEAGRPFKGLYLWGMAEDRLSAAVNNIWKQLLENPRLDLDNAILRHLKPISLKLNRGFSS
jgi:multiple sugar transport system substrate-binding protein